MSTMEQAGDSFTSPEQLELMRLIISCMRAASNIASTTQPTRDLEVAVCRVIALQARRPIQRVLSLWCGWRVMALRKLRAHVGRGDRSATRERLSALEWAVVDVLLLYDMAILSETSYLQQQLEALERTFQVVQQFDLEPERDASPEQWRRAAECYSSNGVQLSAVALQRRWHELKLATRQRACAPAANARSMLPIHQAVASSYAHVASVPDALPSWRELVAAGRVAEPTPVPSPQPEGPLRAPAPAPSEPSEPSSSVSENSDKTKTVDSTHSKDGKIQDSSTETPVVIVPDRKLARPSNTRQHKSEIKRKHPRKASIAKKSVKAIIKVKPEITEIDEDAPSPKADVVTAMKEIDFSTVDATIVYESEEEDVKTILDVQLGVEKDANITKNIKDSESLEIGVSDDTDINKIAGQSKHKTLTKSKVASNLDDSNIMTVQNKDNSLIENNTKDLDNTEETNLNIVITNVWSEKVVNTLDVRKDSVGNVAESRRTSSDSGTISVGSELDYGANYLAIQIAQYLGIWDLTQIDPKLLMEPAISLRRIDQASLNKLPSSTPQSPTRKPTPQVSSQKSLKSAYSKLFYERNKVFLEKCAPCEVSVRRVDGARAGAKRRVQLPDMETVRQNNRGILTAEVAPLVAEVAPLGAELAPLGAEPPKPRQYGPARAKRPRLNTSENNQSPESTVLVEKAGPLSAPPSLPQALDSSKKPKPRTKRERQYEYPFLPINPSHVSNLESRNDSPPHNPTCHFEKEKYLNVPYKNFISNTNQTQDTTHKPLKEQDISTPSIASQQLSSPQNVTQNVSQNIQQPTTQAETNQPSTTITHNSKSITMEHEDSKEGILNRNLVSEPSAPTLTPKQEPVDVELSIPSSQAIASSAYLDPICTIYSDDCPLMSKTGENYINPLTTSLRAPSPLKQLLNQSAPILNTSNPALTASPPILTPMPNLTSQNPLLESTPIPNAPIALRVKTEPKSRTPSPINLPSIKLEPSSTMSSEFTLKTPKTEPKSRSPSPISLPTLETESIPNAPASILSQLPAPTSTLSQPPAPTSTLSQPPAPTSTLSQLPAPTSTLPQPSSPTSTLSQPPAPTSTLSQPPAPTLTLSQLPAPTSTLPQPPAPTSTLSQLPAPTSTLPQPSSPTSTLSQPPAPTSTLSQPPAPTSTLSQPPAPTLTLSQLPAPTSTLPQPPAPTSTLSQLPAPTSTLPQPPAPTSTLSQLPAPTSTLPQPPAPTSTLSQLPAPTSTLPQPPAPTSTLSQLPAPTSTLPQPPAPTSTLSQPPAPTLTLSQPHAPALETPSPLRPPSIKTYTKIRTAKKPPIKPCILGFALKQNVKKPVILNLGPTQEPAESSTTTRSEDHMTDEAEIMDAETDLWEEDRELRGNNLPWRAQVEGGFCESDEFDLGMTFAEAYFLYGEPDPVQSMTRENNEWD